MPAIFVSYRRSDAADITYRICDRLQARFGESEVFVDVDIKPGARFPNILANTLVDSEVVLAVIGRKWLGGKWPARGVYRDDDILRQELMLALEQRIPLIPVLVDGVDMPKYDALPAELREIAEFQAIKIEGAAEFNASIGRLIQTVESARTQVRARLAEESSKRAAQTTPPLTSRATEIWQSNTQAVPENIGAAEMRRSQTERPPESHLDRGLRSVSSNFGFPAVAFSVIFLLLLSGLLLSELRRILGPYADGPGTAFVAAAWASCATVLGRRLPGKVNGTLSMLAVFMFSVAGAFVGCDPGGKNESLAIGGTGFGSTAFGGVIGFFFGVSFIVLAERIFDRLRDAYAPKSRSALVLLIIVNELLGVIWRIGVVRAKHRELARETVTVQ